MTTKKYPLPPLHTVDQKIKLKLWLACDVVEQGTYDIDDLYNLLEEHFNLMTQLKEKI